MGMNMDQYTPEFTAKGVDGQQLLHLDSDKLKVKHKIQIQHLQMSQCCRLIKVCYRKKIFSQVSLWLPPCGQI